MTRVMVLIMLLLAPAEARWKAEYAQQYSPREQQWFRDQKIPNGRTTCCSTADGALVEEDIRGDNYWIRCPRDTPCPFKTWTQVPDAAVIRGPNLIGRPVVWWAMGDDDGEDPHPFVRCYAPGGGL